MLSATDSGSEAFLLVLAGLDVIQGLMLAWLTAGPARARAGRDRRR